MSEVRSRPKPGEIWKTANGHQVKIIAGPSHDVIETAYLGARVNGRLGTLFDADTMMDVRGGDSLAGKA